MAKDSALLVLELKYFNVFLIFKIKIKKQYAR